MSDAGVSSLTFGPIWAKVNNLRINLSMVTHIIDFNDYLQVHTRAGQVIEVTNTGSARSILGSMVDAQAQAVADGTIGSAVVSS